MASGKMTLEMAWDEAERYVFQTFAAELSAKENEVAFRGYLPANAPDVWAFSSGGGSDEIQLLISDNPCFDSLFLEAHAFGQFSSRSKAMQWSGKILQVLKDTANFSQKSNVRRLAITEQPSEPTVIQDEGYAVMWLVNIPMSFIIVTETKYTEG